MFKAVVINKDDEYKAELAEVDESSMMDGDVTVEVAYSTLNYKDGLAITGASPVVRHFPMVPGIDFVGRVIESDNDNYKAGDQVVLNGWGVGEKHWGGLAQKARVQGDWLVPLPSEFEPKDAMAIGTAGYTAMLCVMALEKQGVKPEDGDILVTGAAGGVGSVAIALLSKLGYKVTAVTGRSTNTDYLTKLGATDVVDRSEFEGPGRPLAKERWAGAIDVVGGHTLANVCASVKYRGAVAACGLAGGMDFPATVAPFILRGVTLVGVDSVMCPREERLEAWKRLAVDLDLSKLADIGQEIGLSEVIPYGQKFLDGEIKGRMIVDVNR